jgi:hypothetical protein
MSADASMRDQSISNDAANREVDRTLFWRTEIQVNPCRTSASVGGSTAREREYLVL